MSSRHYKSLIFSLSIIQGAQDHQEATNGPNQRGRPHHFKLITSEIPTNYLNVAKCYAGPCGCLQKGGG